MDGKLLFQNKIFRVETKCSPGKELFIIVKIKGNKKVFKGGIKSEWITTIRCGADQGRFAALVKQLTAKKGTPNYRARGAYSQTSTMGGQAATESVKYRELPAGGYEVTYDTVVVDQATGKQVFKGQVKFQLPRKDITAIASGIDAALTKCCTPKKPKKKVIKKKAKKQVGPKKKKGEKKSER